MIRYMLDTNACIGIINGKPSSLRRRLLGVDPADVSISQIVHYELAFGVCNSNQKQRNHANLTHFLRYVQVLDWGEVQATEAAQIRCGLSGSGSPIGHYDILIAAHARSLDAVLITHNTGEFGRVFGLQIEDWEGQ